MNERLYEEGGVAMKLTGDAEDMHLLQFHTSKSIAKPSLWRYGLMTISRNIAA